MANIAECKDWCKKARKILGLGIIGDSATLKSRTNNVAKYLEKMKAVPALKKEYEEALALFTKLSTDLKAVADKKTSKTYSSKEKEAEIVALSDEIGELEDELAYAEQERTKVLSEAEQFKKAKEAYVAALLKANQEVAFLKVVPKAEFAKLETKVNNIINTAGQDTLAGYTQATNLLKGIPGEAKTEKTEADKRLKKEQEQFGKRPEFLQKLEVVKNTYAEISGLVGVEATLKQYAAIIKAAEDFNLSEQWIEGVAKLKEVDKLPKVKDVKTVSGQKLTKLQGIADYDRGMLLLGKIKAIIPASEVAEDEKAFHAVLDRFLTTENPQIVKELTPIVKKLELKLQGLTATQNELQLAMTEGARLLSEFGLVAPPIEVIPYQNNFDTFKGLWKAGNLAAAKEMIDKVIPAITGVLPEKKKAADTWAKAQGELGTLRQQLTTFKSSECETVKVKALGAAYPIVQQEVTVLETAHDWTKLVANLNRVRDSVKELTELEKQYAAFAKERTDANRLVTSNIATAKQTWQQLALAAKNAGGPPPESLKPLLAEVELLERVWIANLPKAVDGNSLKMLNTLGALAEVQKKMELGASPDGLKALQKEDANNKAKPVFEQNWNAFLTAINQLQAQDNTTAANILGLGKVVMEKAALDYTTAITDLDKYSKMVVKAKELATSARNTVMQEVNQLAEAAKAEIDRADKATSNSKAFADAFKSLRTEHAELLELAKSTNLDALKEAATGFKALKVRATKFAPTTPGAGLSIDKVMVMLKNATKFYEDREAKLKKDVPKTQATLAKQLKTLKAEVLKLDPDDSIVKITAFTKAVTEAETDSSKVAEVRTQYETFVKTVDTSYETFKTRGGMPKYIEAIKARIKEAKEMSKDPGKIYEALQKLSQIDKEMTQAIATPQLGMDKEGEIRVKEQEDAKQKTEWEHGIKVFESKAIKEASDAVAEKGGDKGLLKELQRIGNLARGTAKQKDYGKALQQLALANERAKQIVADPYGPAIGSRNQLPKDSQRFREALVNFDKTLNGFPDVVAQSVTGLDPTVTGKLKTMMAELSKKFDGMAFEGPIQKLTQEGIDDKARRAFREAALVKVRSVQAELAKHPQMIALAANPIAPKEISLAYRRLQTTLVTLDANISRSVS